VARALRKVSVIMEEKDLAVAAPCNVDWRKMTPADGGRFCGDCKKVVRDLSTMRERDARTLLKSAGNGELCVRYLYDKHGKIFFAGDREQLVPASLLQRAKRVAMSAAALAVPLSLAACSPDAANATGEDPDQHRQELYENMGAPTAPPSYDAGPGETDAAPDASDAGPAPDGGDAGPRDDGGGDAGPQDDGGEDAGPSPEAPI
jgi:hypothetical protein